MPDWKVVEALLLQQNFSLMLSAVPNASKVLNLLGDEDYYDYCKAIDTLRRLWCKTGQNL